jgi:hypothetical protein
VAARRKPKPAPQLALADRVRHLIALDAASVMTRLGARHDDMVALFSRLRDRSPMLETIDSWFLTISFGELAALTPAEQKAADDFYTLLGELRWYLQYTDDMPGLVQTRVTQFVRKMETAHRKLGLTIGPIARDAPVVDGEVVRKPRAKTG